MANKQVNIVTAFQRCLADPAHLKAKPGDSITWVNQTGGEVTVFFPHDNVFKSKGRFNLKVDKGKTDGPREPLDNPGEGRPRSFRYAVFSEETGSFAQGHSDPFIIIE